LKEDFARALLGGPWFFGRRGFYLRKWSPGFNPHTESMTQAPIWVRLPGLPLEFWHPA
ncbi:hypothetical protein KI387_005362, partial [Taxus chinensis]